MKPFLPPAITSKPPKPIKPKQPALLSDPLSNCAWICLCKILGSSSDRFDGTQFHSVGLYEISWASTTLGECLGCLNLSIDCRLFQLQATSYFRHRILTFPCNHPAYVNDGDQCGLSIFHPVIFQAAAEVRFRGVWVSVEHCPVRTPIDHQLEGLSHFANLHVGVFAQRSLRWRPQLATETPMSMLFPCVEITSRVPCLADSSTMQFPVT